MGVRILKHIFIVNPAAGRVDATDYVRSSVEALGMDIDYEIYRTSGPKDATKYIKSVLSDTETKYRFYSCGGDGTLNEVVNGVALHDNAEVTVFPCGSGNDFIRYYGSSNDFSNLKDLVSAPSHKIDVLRVGELYAINAVHFGFDTCVLKTMIKVKRKPIIGGKNAYTTGVVKALFDGMKSRCKIMVDSNPVGKNELLLCTLCNGKYVGGGYKCAPKSDNSDGLIEVCHVRPVSRFKFLTLMSAYKNGSHLDDPRFEGYINYSRGKTVEIDGGDNFYLSLDGELTTVGKCTVDIVHNAVNFVVPQKLFKAEINEEEKAFVD